MKSWRIYPGQKIGLLGGSFDPPHEGHAHITRQALKQFGLDAVWWLVSPGNPLKKHWPAPLQERIRVARKVMSHPQVFISDLEERLGTRYTAQTLSAVQLTYPSTRFVWLMGSDNLAQFHLWHNWRVIMHTLPIGVLARPGYGSSARLSRVARSYRYAAVKSSDRRLLARMTAPAWTFVNIPLSSSSSTELRYAGKVT